MIKLVHGRVSPDGEQFKYGVINAEDESLFYVGFNRAADARQWLAGMISVTR